MEPSDGSPPPSLFIVRPSELFPRINMEREDDELEVPFQTLAGEFVRYLGRTTDGILALSTYRIFKLISTTNAETSVPLGLVEIVQLSEQEHIVIYCKDASSFKCSFKTTEQCSEWQRRIHQAIRTPETLESLFAFPFHVFVCDEINTMCESEASIDGDQRLTDGGGGGGGFFGSGAIDYSNEYLERLQRASREDDDFMREVVRLGFDLNGAWRISKANEEFKLCPTYPKKILVPGCITDEMLHEVANYRGSRRLPSVVWRHKRNGAIIARCSQPEVGWLGWRSQSDEQLLKALADACAFDRGEQMRRLMQVAKETAPAMFLPENSPSTGDVEGHEEVSMDEVRKVLIVDARSYTSAIGNRARGGGCECIEYYPCAEIQFMCLGNIHVIRKSFHALRSLCAAPPTDTNWLGLLEKTNWLQHLGGLFAATTTVLHAIEKRGCPVLVHCSDGWDRTPQIVATAQLCLDPYYRTVEGFRVLVEREWLSFGHKFSHRCGHGPGSDDLNERSPIFIQWLDLVHQLHRQFPCSFEFNRAYLIKLAQHLHSCLFGTFLCNSYRERLEKSIFERTFSVWPFLSGPMYRNPLYLPSRDDVLWPKYNLRDLHLWTEVYMGSLGNQNYIDFINGSSENVEESIISANVMANATVRCSSDPNVTLEHQFPYSGNSSEREESPEYATGVITKSKEGNSHQNNRTMTNDELENLGVSKNPLTNTEDTHLHRKANGQVSTNGNVKNDTNDKESRNSEDGNNLYEFHTCASALESDAASKTYYPQNTVAGNENKTITLPNQAADAPVGFITPEKLSTFSDKVELGLSSPYVLLKSENRNHPTSCDNTTEKTMSTSCVNNSILQKNNGTNGTSNCSKILSKSASNGSVASTSSSLNNNLNNCNSNSSLATTADHSCDNKSVNKDEVDSEVDGAVGISNIQQRQHSSDSMNDSIIISPTHRKLEISPSGRCEAISNSGSSVPATPTDFAEKASTSSNGENNGRQRGPVGAASGAADVQRNGRPRLEKRFHLRGVRSLPMTPPVQSERAQMTISCPDGLAHALSEQNLRLQQIVHEHKLREDMLLREIHDMRMVLLKKRCPNCKCNQANPNEEQVDELSVNRSRLLDRIKCQYLKASSFNKPILVLPQQQIRQQQLQQQQQPPHNQQRRNRLVHRCHTAVSHHDRLFLQHSSFPYCYCHCQNSQRQRKRRYHSFSCSTLYNNSENNLLSDDDDGNNIAMTVQMHNYCSCCDYGYSNSSLSASPVADNVENASICSWEAVDDRSAHTSSGSSSIQQSQQQTNTASVLWVPDHAVKRCTNCQNEFWIGRRRHHCRSCGQIFCADCSEFWAPLPDAKLFKPVRLCGPCYLAVTTRLEQQSSTSLIINNMPNYTTSTTTSTTTTNTTLVATTVWTTKGAASSSSSRQHLPTVLGEPVVVNTVDATTTTAAAAAAATTTNTPALNNGNMSIAQIHIARATVLQPKQQQQKQPDESYTVPTTAPTPSTLTPAPATTNGTTINLPQHTTVNAVVNVTTTANTSASATSSSFKSAVPITAAADALQQQQRQNAASAAATASATVAVAAAAAKNSQIESSSMSHMLMAANKNIAASVAN